MRISHLISVTCVVATLSAPLCLELLGSEVPSAEERAGTCQRCLDMADELGVGIPQNDPHTFACSGCHHPHEDRAPEEWRHTCQTEDCHPRAWTKTVFHRISNSALFVRCVECHTPHEWKLEGTDCLSCHEPGVVNPLETGLSSSFPHDVHTQLECITCHESSTRHGAVAAKGSAECQSCHHQSNDRACESCHDTAPAKIRVNVPLRLSQNTPIRQRSLGFEHSYHDMFDCADCHDSNLARTFNTQCQSCHEEHHQDTAQCTSCHEPPTTNAHTLSVHLQSCEQSGCHARSVPFSWDKRNCVVCHGTAEAKEEHNSPDNCIECHEVSDF